MRNHELGKDIPKLGFGLMRLPMIGSEIDMAQLNQMVDLFIENGFTYFDTAYGYVSGRSEGAMNEAVVKRYPREQIQLATKFPIWEAREKDDLYNILHTQLTRTGAGYFDFYMLHSVSGAHIEKLDRLDLWAFMRGVKERGLARHIGMSFHDKAEVLDRILSAHPEIEFVQLQVNYADWEDPNVQSRACVETASRHGCPIIIMEPVRGGMLATLSDEAMAELKALRPDASAASWAIRYCLSIDHVITVLSGMSNLDQMRDNIQSAKDVQKLGPEEYAALEKALAILKSKPLIPCTFCKYCTEKCPKNINIPGIIGVMNNMSRYGYNPNLKGSYGFAIGGRGKASECIECGVCESRCPQHIEIIDMLKDAAEHFEP